MSSESYQIVRKEDRYKSGGKKRRRKKKDLFLYMRGREGGGG